MEEVEVLDMTVVTCDGRHAMVDFLVWDAPASKSVTVRCSWRLGDAQMALESENSSLAQRVLRNKECLDDVRETVLYQRDENRERN
jgi:hypothetical protein